MGYWDTHALTVDNMSRLGPFVDGIVGSEGKFSVLNDALAAGWTRIIVSAGASMNAAVNITTAVSIMAFHHGLVQITGNYPINVSGSDCYFEGFKIVNTAGVGFYVTGARARFYRMRVESCLSHGIHFNAAWGDHEVLMSNIYANGGDGIKIAASNPVRIAMCRIQSNTGWGVNDATNIVQITCSQINANTAGQVNSTAVLDHSVRLT